MPIDVSQFRDMFFEEAREYVTSFESAVLALEREPRDEQAVHEMFRAAHSLKGCSATLGIDDVASFTHVLEGLLDHMREGHVAASADLIELLLASGDTLGALIESAREGRPPPATAAELTARLEAPLAAAKVAAGATDGPGAGRPTRFVVAVQPQPRMLVDGLDPLPMLRELFEVAGVLRIEADTSRIPDLTDLEPERCYVSWRAVVEGASRGEIEGAVREIFEFVEDTCRLTITAEDATQTDEGAAEDLIRRTSGLGQGASEATTLRVATERVDEIINLVGELVIAHAGLREAASRETNQTLVESVSNMGRTLADLQQYALSVRTLPLTTVFCRFPRLVRDLAAELDKEVRLDLVGGETELDKSVIEGLAGPLTHIIRNAMDHGLEGVEQRRAAGKQVQGTLRIEAKQQHGSVVIEVRDDGRGLDKERILTKARKAGLIGPDEMPSEERIHTMIFEPGFSTADSVNDVSGRGVGMDAARDAIEALNGTLQVHSAPGEGTSVCVTLPLTLAILDGFEVDVAGQGYIVPLMSVVEVVRPEPEDIQTVLGEGEIVSVRQEPHALVRLRDVLGLPPATVEESGLVVVVDVLDQRFALLVDDVNGQASVVIKGLDESVRHNPAILGSTIQGDGSIAFLLDLFGVVRVHRSRRREPTASLAQGTPE